MPRVISGNNDLSPHANKYDKYKITTDLKVERYIITSIAANPFHHSLLLNVMLCNRCAPYITGILYNLQVNATLECPGC